MAKYLDLDGLSHLWGKLKAYMSNYVQVTDARLTNARTPLAHTHSKSEITDFPEIPAAPGVIGEDRIREICTVLGGYTLTVESGEGAGGTIIYANGLQAVYNLEDFVGHTFNNVDAFRINYSDIDITFSKPTMVATRLTHQAFYGNPFTITASYYYDVPWIQILEDASISYVKD